MREMKDSGIEWIDKIPANWDIIRLKYISSSITKGNGITKEDIVEEGDTPCVRYGEIYSKYDYHFDKCLTRTNRDKVSSLQYFSYGSLLFAGTGELVEEIGKNIAYIGKENCLAGGDIIVVKHNENPIFLSYALNSYYAQSQKSAGKAKLKVVHISSSDIGNIYTVLPTRNEQNNIVYQLDPKCKEIDNIKSDIQKQIETLEEYKKSLVFDAVSYGIDKKQTVKTGSTVWRNIPSDWKLVDIKYVFEIVKRIAGKEGYNVLSVTQKGLKIKDTEHNEGQLAENYSGYQFVYPTDYVMNHMDLLTGWVDCSTMFGVTSPDYRVFRLRDTKNNNLSYFKYVMQCCYMNRIFYSLGQGVSNLGRWRLQTSTFNNFLIPVPPHKEQERIAEYLDTKFTEINNIISVKQNQLETLDEYKKSLIYEYVTGKKEVVCCQTVFIDPMIITALILNNAASDFGGKVKVQKAVHLCTHFLGLPYKNPYYRYEHGPYDKNIDSYLKEINRKQWFNIKDGSKMTWSKGKKHAEFLEIQKEYANYISGMKEIINFLKPMKTSEAERIATLYAVWNDLIIEGVSQPTDTQIINETMTNWTPNKANPKYETWQNSLEKLKKRKLIPTGFGHHTKK